jgi:hypothetical protein
MTSDKPLATPEQIIADWVANMENALNYFRMQTGLSLDMSPASLDALEGWLLKRYPSSDDILRPGEEDYLDAAARYVGETFRRHLGGRWEIRLDDPQNVHYGLPRLNGLRDNGPPFSPQLEVTTSLARRTGSYLTTRLSKRREKAERAGA